MRWNTFGQDPARVAALADLLLGAASADRKYTSEEMVAVTSTLMKVLGVVQLPDEVNAHIRAFDPHTLDLQKTVAVLNLERDEDKQTVMKLVHRVVKTDSALHERERAYLRVLGKVFDTAWPPG